MEQIRVLFTYKGKYQGIIRVSIRVSGQRATCDLVLYLLLLDKNVFRICWCKSRVLGERVATLQQWEW